MCGRRLKVIFNKIYDLLIAGGAWQTILEGLWATVQIETGARAMALSSGKVDAVFWTRSVTCKECNKTFAEILKVHL